MSTNFNSKLLLDISVVLTGFTEVELLGTGMLDQYCNTILLNCSVENVKYFAICAEEILKKYAKDPKGLEEAVSIQLMPDSCFGGLAKAIIVLWYTGNWGTGFNAVVVSAASYVQGIMWNAGLVHPPGAKQPGYGSWAIPPLSVNNAKS